MSTADRAQAADTATTVEAVLPLLGLRVTAGPIELRGITDDLLDARLVQRRRAGRSVLYYRTAAGGTLLEAQQGG